METIHPRDRSTNANRARDFHRSTKPKPSHRACESERNNLMQDTKRKTNPRNHSNYLLKALSIVLASTLIQACQTGQYRRLSPDEWNAQTNAVNAFSESAYRYGQSQRPTYRQNYQQPQYRQPAQYDYSAPSQPYNQSGAPLFGQGSLFGQ